MNLIFEKWTAMLLIIFRNGLPAVIRGQTLSVIFPRAVAVSQSCLGKRWKCQSQPRQPNTEERVDSGWQHTLWFSHRDKSAAMIKTHYSIISSAMIIAWIPAPKMEFHGWFWKVRVREMLDKWKYHLVSKQITRAEYRARWWFPLRKWSSSRLMLPTIIHGSWEWEWA